MNRVTDLRVDLSRAQFARLWWKTKRIPPILHEKMSACPPPFSYHQPRRIQQSSKSHELCAPRDCLTYYNSQIVQGR